MKIAVLICISFFIPLCIFAQEEEEEEIAEKTRIVDTAFHKSKIAIKTNLLQQFQFTGVDIAVCYPLTKHLYANVDVVGVTDKFFPGKTSWTFPSIAVIGELRYFFPQHSTFDGGFIGPYYRFKHGRKMFKSGFPDYDDYYDVSSHTIGIVAGVSFQPRRHPHIIIEMHTGIGIAVELDIIREDPRLPTLVPDARRFNMTNTEVINPRAGFCIGYAF